MSNIQYKHGDIFQSTAQTLVCPVNVVGVMGAGLAKRFKERAPKMFAEYQWLCQSGLISIGHPVLWEGNKRNILLFPTKQHWRDNSQLEYIVAGFEMLNSRTVSRPTWQDWDITSIAFPKLGCGLGGLQWSEVKPVMERYLQSWTIPVEIWLG